MSEVCNGAYALERFKRNQPVNEIHIFRRDAGSPIDEVRNSFYYNTARDRNNAGLGGAWNGKAVTNPHSNELCITQYIEDVKRALPLFRVIDEPDVFSDVRINISRLNTMCSCISMSYSGINWRIAMHLWKYDGRITYLIYTADHGEQILSCVMATDSLLLSEFVDGLAKRGAAIIDTGLVVGPSVEIRRAEDDCTITHYPERNQLHLVIAKPTGRRPQDANHSWSSIQCVPLSTLDKYLRALNDAEIPWVYVT